MKHNDIVDDLEARLLKWNFEQGKNRLVLSNHEYDIYGVHGEVDVAMLSPRRSYLIEVKTTDSERNFNKAIHQLYKDKRWLMKNYYTDKIHCFYATSRSNGNGYNITEVEI